MNKMRYICLVSVFTLFITGFSSEKSLAGEIIHVFGDWRIEEINTNNSYAFIGVGNVSDPAGRFVGMRYFHLQCFPGSFYVSLMTAYDLKKKLVEQEKLIQVLVWSDNKEPIAIDMYVYNKVVLITDNSKEGQDLFQFIDILTNANESFSFGIKGKSISFNMKNFRPAWITFKTICVGSKFNQTLD